MGSKRKAVTKEDKTSNGCSETTSTQEKLHLHTENSNAIVSVNIRNNVHQTTNGVPLKKKTKIANVVVRRSQRLRNLVSTDGSLGVKSVVECVNLVENKNEEAHHAKQVNVSPVLREKDLEGEVNERSMEEKVDHLVTTVDEFKSKVFGKQNEGPSTEFSYKSLYFESQKKIESLVEANYDLVRKLEFARGKIAAYEAMKDAVGAPKEVLLLSALGKATEAIVSLSPQAVQKCSPPPLTISDATDDPKRRKIHQKKKGKR